MVRSSRLKGTVTCIAAGMVAMGVAVAGGGPAQAMVPAADAPGVAAAKKVVAYAQKVPTKVPITVPLSKRPPTQKKVFVVVPSTVDGTRYANGVTAAAQALGWSTTKLSYPSNPADAVGLIKQAVQQGADYVAASGASQTVLQPALDALRAANIPFFSMGSDAIPAGTSNWIFGQSNPSTGFIGRGRVLADAVTAYSNGNAKTLFFNIPQFVVFSNLAVGLKQEYAKVCTGCTIDTIDAPLADALSGKASSAVIAYLRSHPEINTLVCGYMTFCLDLPAKAAAAGITIGNNGIQFYGGNLNDADIPNIVAGTTRAVITGGTEYFGWQSVDAMARYSVKNSLVPNWKAPIPTLLYTKANTTLNSQVFAGPTNYTGQFKKLWRR